MRSPLTTSLFAISLVATIAHATRLDQSLAFKGRGESSDDLIPYPECIKTCDMCFCTRVWPPEHSMCSCAKESAAEEEKELRKNSDLLVGPVGKRIRGEFIPYPECMEKCDECTICTRDYPIERAYCVCVNHDDDSASSKKLVRWTKAKVEPMPYKECVESCEGHVLVLLFGLLSSQPAFALLLNLNLQPAKPFRCNMLKELHSSKARVK